MSDQLFPAGTVIDGRYRIIRPLGQGGFARVYEAEHLNLERRAALKILNYVAEPGDTFYKRFVREAKIAANLDHPNVVTIFDFGVVEGRNLPYIAMEALSGHDLYEELTDNGPMTPARAIPLFMGALDALGEGHKRGIVHKDLKPSNLFLVKPGTPQERLVVVDYGIARLNDQPDGQLTRTGAMSGTPAYLAPEYFQNQSVTPALDVYQMGLILAETLTGQRVVDAATPVAIAVAHTSGQHNIPKNLRDSPIGPFIDKALRVEPGERFANANEMRRALEQIPTPGPNVSFGVDPSDLANKSHTPEAFAETALTPSSDFERGPQPGVVPGRPAASADGPAPPESNDWNGSPARAGQGTSPGAPGSPATPGPRPAGAGYGPGGSPPIANASGATPSQPFRARAHAGPTDEAPRGGSKKVMVLAIVGFLGVGLVAILVLVAMLVALGDQDASVESYPSGEEGGIAIEDFAPNPNLNDVSLAPNTSGLNQKLYGYTYAHASLFVIPYMMGFYESFKANFGLKNGENVMIPPDLGMMVDMSLKQLRRSMRTKPSRRKVDQAAKEYVAAYKAFRPILEDADTYYNQQRRFEEDGMQGGRALDARIMKAWPRFRDAEERFADLLYKNWVDHQDDLIVRYGKAGNQPVRLRAARLVKAGAELMIAARKSPTSSIYRKKLDEYDKVLASYRDFARDNEPTLDSNFGIMDPHKSIVAPARDLSQNAHKYSKSIDEAKALAKRTGNEPNPVPEVQFMTQAFHQMVSQQNQLLANH